MAERELRKLLEEEALARQDAIRALEDRVAHLEQQLQCRALSRPEENASSKGSSSEDSDFESGCLVNTKTMSSLDQLEDSYAFNESAWDATVFAFVGPVTFGVSLNIIGQLAVNLITQGFFIWVVWSFMCEDPVSDSFLESILRFRAGVAHDVSYADTIHGLSLARQICEQDERIPWAGMQFAMIGDLQTAKEGGRFLCTLAVGCWLLTLIGELDSTIRFGNAISSLTHRKPSHLHVGRTDGVRLENIHPVRLVVVMTLAMVPRLVIVLCLMFVGIQFLVSTTSMGDLLLNSLALAFIIDIDDMLYAAFSPSDLKSLMRDVEPVVFSGARKRPMGLNAVMKAVIVFGTLIFVYHFNIRPVYKQIDVAWHILCSGEKDFIFGVNYATNMAQVVHSYNTSILTWTARELSILQLTNMTVAGAHGIPDEVIDAINSPTRTALFTLGPVDVKNRLRGQSSKEMSLQDLQPRMDTLQEIELLSSQNIAQQTQNLACSDMTISTERGTTLMHLKEVTGGNTSCADAKYKCGLVGYTSLRAICPVTCGCPQLIDSPAGYYGAPGYGCPKRCGLVVPILGKNKDVPCLDATPDRFIHDKHLKAYIRAAIAYVGSEGEMLVAMDAVIRNHGPLLGVPSTQAGTLVSSINNGTFAAMMSSGKWDIVPGYPHPRGLQGCEYWTSWEVSILLTTDFCDSDWYRTLQPYCPQSCGCEKGGTYCPPKCTEGTPLLPYNR